MQASPQKSLTPGQTTGNNSSAPMLSQALQKRPGAVASKRATPVRKPGNPGVIGKNFFILIQSHRSSSPSLFEDCNCSIRVILD